MLTLHKNEDSSPEAIIKEFEIVRNNYNRELAKLRKKYKSQLVSLALRYEEATGRQLDGSVLQ